MKRILILSLAAGLLLAGLAPIAGAAVNVERTGSENPMQEVAKSTVWGGIAGLVLGSAIALANNGDNGGDIIKWSFVGGTFLGFGYGLYHVSSRPRPSALLEVEEGTVRLGSLAPTIEPGNGARIRLVSLSF